MVNDVEKRWPDGGTFRRASSYVLAIIVIAALVAAAGMIWADHRARCAAAEVVLCDSAARFAVLFGPVIVLMLGGIGAFVITYRVWRRRGGWPIWQGAGWFLFVLMTMYMAIGGSAVAPS
ncbi:hypothetical protein [Nocardia sp. NPDC050710]|uniref:hypothetical protein n=1 Tax=Nocardia sp. NPDC050710 TaxID=3157220 RepID=UPI00340FFBE4